MLFVAPEPCGAVPVAADCKGAVADCELHMAKSKPGMASCMWHLPIRNFQVLSLLCIFYVHVDCSQWACMQGEGAYLLR